MGTGAGAGGQQINEEQLRQMGPLRAFLQTLLPWVDVAALGAAPGAGEGNAGGIDVDLDLQQLLGGPAEPAAGGGGVGGGGGGDGGARHGGDPDPPPPPAPDVD